MTMASERKLSTRAEARWEDGYRTDIRLRHYSFVADEPPRSGGQDSGPMPTEYLLVSLSSCFATALAHEARKRDLALGPLIVAAVGTYDGPSFGAIDLEVTFDEGPPAGIDELVERARRVCYVSRTLARSPTVTVSVVRAGE